MAASSKRERGRTQLHVSSSCSQMHLTERAEGASGVAPSAPSTPQETSRVGRGAPKLPRSAPLTLLMLFSWNSILSDINIVMPSFVGIFPEYLFPFLHLKSFHIVFL